jgi:Protein of unknown function (DUF1761)
MVYRLPAAVAGWHWPHARLAYESCGEPLLQYGTAFVCAALVATAISCVVQATGFQTALRGIKVAILLWIGFVFTTWATEYVFEVRPLSLFAIDAGFWLIGMTVQGAIVGAWKRKVLNLR